MSTRAMRLKTQARALACLQVVYLTLSVVKEQSLSASLVRLEKELFPLYLTRTERRAFLFANERKSDIDGGDVLQKEGQKRSRMRLR